MASARPLTLLVLAPAAGQLIKVHPFELSYYNELVGGPRGAWRRGFELSYWYDAFNPRTLDELNAKLPRGAVLDFFNHLTNPSTFAELQSLGELSGNVVLTIRDQYAFPYLWLLTQDSKATPLTRLLFAMKPWYCREPAQLDGLRVATVADPSAVSRAWALQLLADGGDSRPVVPPAAPRWVRRFIPWMDRFWDVGPAHLRPPGINDAIFEWARTDPAGLRASARALAAGEQRDDDPKVRRLLTILARVDRPEKPGGLFSERLLRGRPEALVEAVEILIRRPDAVRTVLTRFGYTDPATIGGFLDRDLPGPARSGSARDRPGRDGVAALDVLLLDRVRSHRTDDQQGEQERDGGNRTGFPVGGGGDPAWPGSGWRRNSSTCGPASAPRRACRRRLPARRRG